MPFPVRPVMVALIRRGLRKAMYAQGTGRHSKSEIVRLGTRGIDAIAAYLGEKPYFMGSEPTAADASIFAFVAGTLCPFFEMPLRTAAERHDNLRRYVGRMTARFYPGWTEIAGCAAAA
jgi:glutathione S-transferase